MVAADVARRVVTSRIPGFAEYQAVCSLLYEEGACLDEQRWDDWLNLYTEDAVFWTPAWDSEHTVTTDPQNEVSLLYIEGKEALSDRVWRWASGDSPASTPLPRTSHLMGNVRIARWNDTEAEVQSRWHTQVYRQHRTWSYAGSYRHTLRRNSNNLQIREKYVVLANDLVDTTLDLYHL